MAQKFSGTFSEDFLAQMWHKKRGRYDGKGWEAMVLNETILPIRPIW